MQYEIFDAKEIANANLEYLKNLTRLNQIIFDGLELSNVDK